MNVPFYKPGLAQEITEHAQEIIRTTFGHLSQILPYEQLDDLMAHGLLEVEDVPELIFLDVDGVLNNKFSWPKYEDDYVPTPDEMYMSSFDDQCVGRLLKILDEFPKAKIVVSSTWRIDPFLMGILKIKLGDYSRRIIGQTIQFSHGHRGMEIEHYLLTHHRGKKVKMVIVDDDSDFFPHQLQFHVPCDTEYGITEAVQWRIGQRLKSMERIIP